MAEEGRIGRDVVQIPIAHRRMGRPPAEECKVPVKKRGRPPEGNRYGIFLEDD